ncbi:MAG: OmpA family protein [Bdellovibrionaceae bacterium]|nr:OmpA family protein [Pseudobdellovibrionaceae bacterium]
MRKRHEENENHERWLVSYADFITLLFAFFVVMYATSTNNIEKQKEFENSVRVNLKLSSHEKAQGALPDAGAVIAEYLQGSQEPENFPQKGSPGEAADFATRYLSKKVEKSEAKNLSLEIRHDAVGVRVSLAASEFFNVGDYKLKKSALATLDHLASLLRMTDKKVIVEGHTDDLPIGSEQIRSNWDLGGLRASSVVQYFVKYQNIVPNRLAAISYADQKPIAINDNEENRRKNRRIEILIVTQDEK